MWARRVQGLPWGINTKSTKTLLVSRRFNLHYGGWTSNVYLQLIKLIPYNTLLFKKPDNIVGLWAWSFGKLFNWNCIDWTTVHSFLQVAISTFFAGHVWFSIFNFENAWAKWLTSSATDAQFFVYNWLWHKLFVPQIYKLFFVWRGDILKLFKLN